MVASPKPSVYWSGKNLICSPNEVRTGRPRVTVMTVRPTPCLSCPFQQPSAHSKFQLTGRVSCICAVWDMQHFLGDSSGTYCLISLNPRLTLHARQARRPRPGRLLSRLPSEKGPHDVQGTSQIFQLLILIIQWVRGASQPCRVSSCGVHAGGVPRYPKHLGTHGRLRREQEIACGKHLQRRMTLHPKLRASAIEYTQGKHVLLIQH